jgi:hypothetical protein
MIKDFGALIGILLIVAILLFWIWVISEGVL